MQNKRVIADRGNAFPPSLRLHSSREFNKVREKGRKQHTPHFIVLVLQKGEGETRLGLTVSRKIGCAVRRNRVKRLVREFFRTHHDILPRHLDISVIAKKGAPNLHFDMVRSELSVLIGKMFSPRKSCSGK